MHETSVARSIIEIASHAAEEHGATRVMGVAVSVGALAHIDDDALRFAFDALKDDTSLAGASLTIERMRLAGRCGDCGAAFETDVLGAPCPGCGSVRIEWSGESETRVVSIDVDDAPEPGSATIEGDSEEEEER